MELKSTFFRKHTAALPALAQDKRFQLAVEASPNAMLMVDQNGLIELFNTQAETLFGYAREDILGLSIETLVPIHTRDKHKGFRDVFAKFPKARRMGNKSSELYALHRDGHEIPVEIGLNPVDTEDGQYVLVAIVDITERRRLENLQQRYNEQLAAANESLKQNNLKLQQFASMASHDLQAPLRHISGLVQLLHINYAEQLDEKAKDLINRTVRSVQTLQSLLDDLLMFSRMEARNITPERVPLHQVYGEVTELLGSLIQESDAEIDCGVLPEVLADRSLMSHLFQNLISNSIKYRGDQPPRIQIASREEPDHWVISITDNGIGIDPRFHAKIFEVFQRLNHSKPTPGSGLGLAICRSIVERHGGEIRVQSNPGQGSTFSFSLPKLTLATVDDAD